MEHKYKQLDLLAIEKSLPSGLVKEIKKSIYKSMEAITLDDQQSQELLQVLSKTDRFNIAMHMYSGAANKVLFLLEQNDAFKANVLPLLGYKVVDIDLEVYSKDDYADEVYFIVTGAVNFLYGNDFCFRNMLAGSHFGEYEVIKRKPREFSVMT
jgi:CRP-like cAMP-binding protein